MVFRNIFEVMAWLHHQIWLVLVFHFFLYVYVAILSSSGSLSMRLPSLCSVYVQGHV